MSTKMVAGLARAEFAKRWASVLKNRIRFYFSPAFADSLGLFVSVGSKGIIYTSTNGSSWKKRESPVTTNLYAAYWNGSMFVVVGANGVILTSTDGITWTLQTSGVSSSLYAVAWNGSMFVVVGTGGLILTSSDGVTWITRTSGTTANLRDIVWTGSQFVAIGDGGVILYSADGINWTLGNIGAPAGTVFFDILWNGSMFVAVGTGGAIYTSIDGITWIQRSSGVTSTLYSVIWDGTQFIIVGANGTILSSPDGITWTVVASGGSDLLGLVLYNGKVTITGDGVALTSDAGGSLSFSETVLDSELLQIPEFGSLLFTLDNPNSYGTSATDQFGNSVDTSDQYVIVGAIYEDDATSENAGKAYVFSASTGALLHTFDNPNAYGSGYDHFGSSVAISDQYAVVGAFQEADAGGGVSGKAYVYRTSDWTLVHTLTNPNAYGTSAGDYFGWSVAISDQYAIVGATYEDDAVNSGSGRAYIYRTSDWTLLHTLNSSAPTANARFGSAVAISDQYAVVGDNVQKVHVFNTSTGALLHTLNNPDVYVSIGDQFGLGVAISDQYAIVGSRQEDEAGGTDSGKAYIYRTSDWTLLHTLNNPNAYGTVINDRFGWSVAISDQYAIVGTTYEDDAGGTESGKAYVFNPSTGALLHTLDNPNAYGTSAGDFFGHVVAISDQYAVVGASGEDDSNGTSSSKAYIYRTSDWTLLSTLDNPNAFAGSYSDFFGWSVAISDQYAIVGAIYEDDATSENAGKAYVFSASTGALLHTFDNPNAYGTSAGDYFGWSVAISDQYAIVGTLQEDDAGGTDSGKAYIFSTSDWALLHTLNNPNAYGTSASDYFGYSVAISNQYAIVGTYQEDDVSGTGSGKAYIFSLQE